jgi:Tol biopolymer transport system component/DNA-binding winged helix-turn-helix (wHTH) protein
MRRDDEIVSAPSYNRHRFGNVVVDSSNLRVTVDGEPRALEPKSFRLLQFLIENRGRVVSKEEILQAVWAGSFVSDNALTRAIAQVRKAIGDDPKEPRYIETIPTVGYRFTAATTVEESVREVRIPTPCTPAPARTKRSRLAVVGGALVLVAIAAFLVWRSSTAPRGDTSVANFLAVQFSSSPGLDVGASFSPDGSHIAYSSDKSGTFEIYVRSFEPGARELQITDDGNQNLYPAFSPDGRSIAYASLKQRGIFRVAALGGSARRLTDFGVRPVWSPDGNTIVFQSAASASPSATDYYFPGIASLWTISASGGNPKPVGGDGSPAGGSSFPSWSPDGAEIRFVNDVQGESSIWTYRLADGSFRKLFASTTLPYSNATFSPDGKRMWFVKWLLNGDIGIWKIDLDSGLQPVGEATPVYQASFGAPRDITVSRDGKRLAFTGVLPTSQIMSQDISVKKSEPIAITRDVSYRYALVRSSPDGTRVVYTSFPRNGLPRLWLANPDGGEPIAVGAPDGFQNFGAVNAANDSVFFLQGGSVEGKIFQQNLIDGSSKEFSAVPRGANQFSFSPNGAAVVYHSDRDQKRQVYWQDVMSGTRRVLASGPEAIGFPRFSRDGAWVSFEISHRAGGDDIGVVAAAGGPIETILRSDEPTFVSGWMPDNDRILFAGFRGGAWNIYSVSRSTKKVERLTDFRLLRTYVRYPDWLAHDRIVYEFNETKGNIFVATLR